jgi:ferrous iron transport protein A
MTIIQCKINQEYTVKKLHTTGDLRHRLISFGIIKGAQIRYLAHTNLKSTYEIQVGNMSIALRKSEAQMIEVVEV